MFLQKRNSLCCLIFTGWLVSSQVSAGVEFEPGVGLGAEFTDNAALTRDNRVDDTITTGYVGGRVSENEGALQYDTGVAFYNQHYTQDTFDDQRYFNLDATANWEMIRNHFDWFMSDAFNQRPIVSNSANTPDNIEDSNVFALGANIFFPLAARHNFTLTPTFNQYYYEILATDNKQYSLVGNWQYQHSRLLNISFNLSARKINYTEEDLLGRSPEDVVFTSLSMIFNGQRARATYSINLGATNVKRDNGQETDGFTGSLDWQAELSSRSQFQAFISTDLTDSSSIAFNDSGGNEVQITADVIRESLANVAYIRDDELLRSRLSLRYRKLKYSESPLDSITRNANIQVDYPLSQLLSSGVSVNYNREERLDTNREDKRYTVSTNLSYRFSRKLRGLFDLMYRKKESTFEPENYDELSVFVSLVYGYGSVLRPARTGGF